MVFCHKKIVPLPPETVFFDKNVENIDYNSYPK